MHSKSQNQNCTHDSKYSGGPGFCNHSKCQLEDIPAYSQGFLPASIGEIPICKMPINQNHSAEIHQSVQDSCMRESTSGFKLLSVKRLSMDNNKKSNHGVNALLIGPLLNGNGNTHGNTANVCRLYLDNPQKCQAHTCHECHMSIEPPASDRNEAYEDTDEVDGAELNNVNRDLCTCKCSSRCTPAHSREYISPYNAIVNHLNSGNSVSSSYAPSRYNHDLMQTHSAINNVAPKQSDHQTTINKVESSDSTSATKGTKSFIPQHITSSTCNSCRVPCGHWDIQCPSHPYQVLSKVAAVDHSNNSHFHFQPTQSIQTAPVSGHSSPNQANVPLLINDTSSVPESTSFCTTTATSSQCLTANNCEFETASVSHNGTSGWLIQMQDNSPVLIYPNDFHLLRHHHQMTPVIVNSAPAQPVFSTTVEDGSNLISHPIRKCGVVEMGSLVPIASNNTHATTATVIPTNDVVNSAALENLTSHFLMGSGITSLTMANTDQPQNSQIAITGPSSALTATLQPASRFRKARIYETVEQWSYGRTSVHDCRLKVIPEWVVKLRGKSDVIACEKQPTNCLSCQQFETFEILPVNEQPAVTRKTQPATSVCDVIDTSDGNTCNLPAPLSSCNESKASQLFSYWKEGSRVNEHSMGSLQVYLSAGLALEHHHQADMPMVHTNGDIDQPSELLLYGQINFDDTVGTSSPPNLQEMILAGQHEAQNGISTSLRLSSSSSDTGPNSPIPPDSDTITQLHSGQHRLDPSTDYLRRYPTAAPLSSPSSSLLPDPSVKVPVDQTREENGGDCTTVPGLHSVSGFQTVPVTQQQYLPDSSSVYLLRDACKSSHNGGEMPAADSPLVGCELVGRMLNNQQESSTVPAALMATNCEDCRRYFLVTSHKPSTSASLGNSHVAGLPNGLHNHHQTQQKCCCSHRASTNPQRPGPTRSQNDAAYDSTVTAQHFEARIHECVDSIRLTLLNALRDMETDKQSLTSQLNAYHVALHQLRDFVPCNAWDRICGGLTANPPAPSSRILSNGATNASKFEGQHSSSLPQAQNHQQHQELSLH